MTTTPNLGKKLKGIVEICETAQTAIDGQREIIKGALEAGQVEHGLDPAAVRRVLSWRKARAKDPAKIDQADDLDADYRFMLGDGIARQDPVDDELSRVVALTNTDQPPSIDAIKKALGCSQGKAQKMRCLAAARLALRSSSSNERELEMTSPAEGINPKATPASVQPRPAAWEEITSVANEYTDRAEQVKEAAREDRQRTNAARDALNRRVEETDLKEVLPDYLDATKRQERVTA